MESPANAPNWLRVVTAEERPDLWDLVNAQNHFHALWPEYNFHGNHAALYFKELVPMFTEFQVLFVDERSDQVMARGRTIPFRWDGTLGHLPPGIDALGTRAITKADPPSALSALSAEVDLGYQRSGLSALLIKTMRNVAQLHGLAPLVAPVRPNWKDRYPLIPIERYTQWRREDGSLFDPWLRTHERMNATILRAEPESLKIEHPVGDWESWTGMVFPGDGDYTFPFGLAPLHVEHGTGSYWEPNVWMLHEV